MKGRNLRFVMVVLIAIAASGSELSKDYSNELEGFKLFDKYCRGLKPMKSTAAKVEKVLGKLKADASFETEEDRAMAFVNAGGACRAIYYSCAKRLAPENPARKITLVNTRPPDVAPAPESILDILMRRHG